MNNILQLLNKILNF